MTVSSPASHTAQELELLLDRHRAHAPTVKKTTARERTAKLDRMMAYLDREEAKRDLLAAFAADLSKHEVEVLTSELGIIYGHVGHVKQHLGRWMAPRRVSTPLMLFGTRSYVHYEPKGCALILSPWNYPLSLTLIPLVYAIAAGCTAVVKPSESTPRVTEFMRRMVAEVFPEEEVTVVTGEGDTAAALTALPFDHIFFTGSPAIGKKVMAAAAENLASVTLELGGKSPCVIDRSVDIKKSSANVVWGKCFNAGQTCVAPDYLLIHRAVFDEYIAALEARVTEFYGTDPRASPDLARIVNGRQFDHLKSLYDDALAKGAGVAFGGTFDRDELYVSPTALVGVTEDMKIMREEVFGPLWPVLPYASTGEAIDIINRRAKPLAFYVQSRDRRVFRELVARTGAGGTLLNEMLLGTSNPSLPFGGVNNSGIGKGYGHEGFMEFTNGRSVMERRFLDLEMFYPPYTDRIVGLVRRMYKWL